MAGFVSRRLASAAFLLFLVLSATFFLVHLAPGEPAKLLQNERISQETREELQRFYGLDRPLPERYLSWLGGALRGDLGVSHHHGRPVMDVLLGRLPATTVLVAAGVAIELLLGFVLALAVARRPGSAFDQASRWLSVLLYSTPVFVLGLFLIEILAVRWPLFPAQQMLSAEAAHWPLGRRLLDLLHHLALPALTLGLVRCGPTLRFLRNNLLEIVEQDYVRTARAKGLGEARVLWVHALPNAVGPVIQRLGVSLPLLLSGTLVLEVVFAWPGLGQVVYAAVFQRDYPLILAATAFTAALVVLGSFLADVVHAWIDPRLRARTV